MTNTEKVFKFQSSSVSNVFWIQNKGFCKNKKEKKRGKVANKENNINDNNNSIAGTDFIIFRVLHNIKDPMLL